jgi:hypothetical protein
MFGQLGFLACGTKYVMSVFYMKRTLNLTVWFSLGLFLTSCQPGHRRAVSNHLQGVAEVIHKETEVNVKFSPTVSKAQAELLEKVFHRLQALRFKPNESNTTAFARAFEGKDPGFISRFLEKRLHYILANGDIESHIEMSNTSPKLSRNYLVARLIGQTFGLNALRYFGIDQSDVRYMIVDELPIDFSQATVGAVNLTLNFQRSFSEDAELLSLSELIHESRHSDCPLGFLEGEPLQWKSLLAALNKLVRGSECFYGHVRCPSESQFRDKLACDPKPWGAYSFGYVFNREVGLRCEDCSAVEVENSLYEAVSSAERLIFLPKSAQIQLLRLDQKMKLWHHSKEVFNQHLEEINTVLSQVDLYLISKDTPNPSLQSMPVIQGTAN